MNRLVLVLLLLVFPIASFAGDGTVSFNVTVANDCTVQVVDVDGGLVQVDALTISSVHSDDADDALVLLNCPLASTVSISAPSETSGTLTADVSFCSFANATETIIGDTFNPRPVTAGFSDTVWIRMWWGNTTTIPDGSYTFTCTITATPS